MFRILFTVLVVGLLAPAALAQERERNFDMEPLNAQRANMNEYIDYVFLSVAELMRDYGVVPMELPDLSEGFSYRPLLITYSGWVNMTNGVLGDISEITRNGDAFMSYNRLLLRIEAGATLQSMNFVYDYRTTVMGLGLFTGWIDGYAENIVIRCDFLIDMYDFFIFMQGFRVTSIGRIDVNLRGNILTDWLGNIIIDIVTFFFRNTITQIVSDRVQVFVQEMIDNINSNRFTSASQMALGFQEVAEKLKLEMPPYNPDKHTYA